MRYEGVITPMITPFKKNGEIDLEATDLLIERIKGYGSSGLFPLGSTGLFSFLQKEERDRFLRYVIDNAHGLPVLAGVGSSSTQEAISYGKKAMDFGVNALVLMPTYYITPGQEEIKDHYSRFFESVSGDTFVYNIPQLTQAWIQPETARWLMSQHSQIIGLKESSGDMRYLSKLMALKEGDFSIFQGQDDLLVPSLSLGASGGVCGLTNFSDAVVRAYRAYKEGSYEKAMEIQLEEVDPIIHALQNATFPSLYYDMFYRINEIEGGFRSPMLRPSRDLSEFAERTISHVSPEKI